MRKIVAAIVGAVLFGVATAVAGAAPALADERPSVCPTQPISITSKLTERPVIYVHGWLGKADKASAAAADGPVQLLQKRLGAGYRVLAFDYSWANQEWGATKKTRECLTSYMREASLAFQASGGDGRILAVGHSMGGIAIRAASTLLEGVAGGNNMLAGVVTLSTPHQGSPWGGTIYADLYQGYKGYTGESTPLPASGTSAALCLAWPRDRSCDSVPYLPVGTKVATIGTQIMMTRKLFDIPYVEGPTAEFPLFGDAIVPTISSNGYVPSAAPAPYPKGEFLGEQRPVCSESAGYLSQQLVKGKAKIGLVPTVIATLAGTIVEEFIDMRALDTMMQGKADISQLSFVVLAQASECFHTNMPSSSRVDDAAVAYLKKMAPKAVGSDLGPVLSATKLVTVRPWVDGSEANPSRVIDGKNATNAYCNGSNVAARADAFRCFVDQGVHDPCLQNPANAKEYLCYFGSEKVLIQNVRAESTSVSGTAAPEQSSPFLVTLADGTVCRTSSGAGPPAIPGYPYWTGSCSGPHAGIWRARYADRGSNPASGLLEKTSSGVWHVAIEEDARPGKVSLYPVAVAYR